MNIINRALYLCFWFTSVSSFLNADELKISLGLIKELEIRHCVLVGNAKEAEIILDIKKFSMANILVLYLNLDQLKTFIDWNVKGLFKVGLVFDGGNLFHLSEISQTLEKENNSYLMAQYNWIVFSTNYQENSDKLIVPYNCEFIVIQSQNSATYELTEYYVVKNRSFSFDYGTWDNDFGLKLTNITFNGRRSNLHKSVINVISSQSAWDDYLVYEILNGLAYAMNFSLEKTDDSRIGDITDSLLPFDSRFRNYDKLGPISKKEITWYVKHPRPAFKSEFYLQPFEISLWLAVLCIMLTSTALIIIQNLTQNEKRFIVDDIFIGFESFCNQRGSDNFKNASTRLIYLLLRITALVTVASYVATIRSFLSLETKTQTPHPPFTNLQEFVENGQYRLQTRRHSLLDIYLSGKKDPFSQYISDNFIQFVSEDENLGTNVCYGRFAMEGVYADIRDMPCAVFKIPQPIASFFVGLFLQKESPYTKMFSYHFHRYYEGGIQKGTQNTFSTSQSVKYIFGPVGLELMSQVLLIPFIGVLLALPIIVIEILSMCCRLKRANKAISV